VAIVPRSRKFANPFYSLLLAAGIAFGLTATAYVVMAFRDVRSASNSAEAVNLSSMANREHPLMDWMRRHGTVTLLTELGLLALFTFAAIGTDDFWQRRANSK
jgi:hypothetical protein